MKDPVNRMENVPQREGDFARLRIDFETLLLRECVGSSSPIYIVRRLRGWITHTLSCYASSSGGGGLTSNVNPSVGGKRGTNRVLLAFILFALPTVALAQTDEIQVYDAVIAEPGIFNLMIHTNYTPIGRKVADYPGGIIPDHSVNGAAEWAYGVTPWFEQGLYLPVWTPYSQGRGGSIDGFKIRELFVRPHADDHTFFYGVNFELSVNYHYWEPRRVTSEVRPIVGLHLHPVDIIFNPIVDTQYRGGFGNLEFVPATRIAYNLNDKWAVAAEEYSDFGPLRQFDPIGEQFHEVWAVVDHPGKLVSIETGVGVGVTGGADRLTFKLMLSRDLNSKSK